MFTLENIIEVINGNEVVEATELLNRMDLKLTGDNYKRLKFLLLANGCTKGINHKKHVTYTVDEMNLRKELAQIYMRLARY